MTNKTRPPQPFNSSFPSGTPFQSTLSFALAFAYCLTVTVLLPHPSYAEKARQKVIDFEGDVVEGVNKRPLDSLTQISEKEKRRRKIHLYHKRRGFRTETQETLREMRYAE